LADSSKTYRGEVELGVATDTYDASGRVIRRQDPSSVSRDGVEEALSSFVGDVEQKPPMYSAIKYEGKRLYELARAGIEVERGMRKVYISRLELVSWQPPFLSIEVDFGKGTYIRALAHDLGQALGCGAHLKDLVRLRCGIFDLESGIALPQLEDAFCGGYWQHFLYPIDQVLLDWDAAILGEKDARLVRDGRPVFLEAGSGDRCRAYTLDGRFLSVLRWEEGGGFWHPDKVFAPEP
jgi:tRNA pseudouridine55 synthase